jgi:hypothetical protein
MFKLNPLKTTTRSKYLHDNLALEHIRKAYADGHFTKAQVTETLVKAGINTFTAAALFGRLAKHEYIIPK